MLYCIVRKAEDTHTHRLHKQFVHIYSFSVVFPIRPRFSIRPGLSGSFGDRQWERRPRRPLERSVGEEVKKPRLWTQWFSPILDRIRVKQCTGWRIVRFFSIAFFFGKCKRVIFNASKIRFLEAHWSPCLSWICAYCNSLRCDFV